MNWTKIDQIVLEDRQRKEFSPKELLELKKGILSKGLLHAPVVRQRDGKLILVAGERRLRAMKELHEEGHKFRFSANDVPPGTIPVVFLDRLTEDDYAEAELEENILRSSLTWMEEVEAKAKIHRLRLKQNPKQTITNTAREISNVTGSNLNTEKEKLATALLIDKNKSHPKVKAARNEGEAVRALLDEQEARFKSELLMRDKLIQTPHELKHGDCRQIMKETSPGIFDLILTDPPYGMNAHKMSKDEGHFYDDSPENALDIAQVIFSEGFRITKPKALLFMFCDPIHFHKLIEMASRMAWTPWRTPLVWYKGKDGHAPWGRAGFTRTTEFILFASKGQRELTNPGGPDLLDFPRAARGSKVHAAEKPVTILKHLISKACLPGDRVLDPCCGSGSIFAAATAQRVVAAGIELDKAYYDQAYLRMMNPVEETAESVEATYDVA